MIKLDIDFHVVYIVVNQERLNWGLNGNYPKIARLIVPPTKLWVITMLVYRLEHLSGIGPYHTDKLKKILKTQVWNKLEVLSFELCDTHSSSLNHPIPSMSFVNRKSCACESFDKLCEWFDGFLEKFAQFGYFISVYDAMDIKSDFNQVVFDKGYAKLVERISIL